MRVPFRFLCLSLALLGLAAIGAPALAAAPPKPAATAESPAAVSGDKAATPQAPEIPEAQPLSFKAEVAPTEVRLGEPFALTLEVVDQADVQYELPRDFTLGKDFALHDVAVMREPVEGGTRTRFSIRAALFELGERKLDDLLLSATGPEGARKLTLPGPSVQVVGQIGEEEEASFADVLPPVRVGVPSYLILWLLLGSLAAAALAFWVVRYLRHRPRRAPKAAADPPPLPPHLQALRDLHALRQEDLAAQGRGRELFFRISEILRAYLGRRYAFEALDMTTSELLGALSKRHTPGLDFSRFERHCLEGDLVRYAKSPATLVQCKEALEDALCFVQATAPDDSAPKRGADAVAGTEEVAR